MKFAFVKKRYLEKGNRLDRINEDWFAAFLGNIE